MMERYYVKRPTGKVFGPFDQNAINMMLKAKKIGADAQVSTDKEVWTPLSQVPAFAEFAGGGADQAFDEDDDYGEDATRVTEGWDFEAEDANLPASRSAGLDLPAPRSSGLDLPTPRSAGSNLPTPRSSGLDLPTPRSAGSNLPASRSGLDLPTPRAAGSNLPASRSGMDLPVRGGSSLPARASNLPGSTHTPPGLPASAGQLPSPAGQLPSPAGQLPSPAGQLPAPRNELPQSKGDDLFGAPGLKEDSDLFASPGLKEESDDLFAAPAGMEEDSDLFAAPAGMEEDSDLFAAPGLQEESDDLFASPGRDAQDDDLFASPPSASPPAASALDEDDLFGAPLGMEEESDDLFAAPPSGSSSFLDDPGDDDDFLGGNQGFSFLDESPPDANAPGDDWGESLLGNEPSEPVNRIAEPPPSRLGSRKKAEARTDDSRQMASSGPRQMASTGARTTTGKNEAVAEDKKRGSMTLIGVVVLAIVVLGGGGYALFSHFMGQENIIQTEAVEQVRTYTLDIHALKSDNYADLVTSIDRAKGARLTPSESGKVLLAESLMLARYEDETMAAQAKARADALPDDASDPYVALGKGAFEASSGNPDSARAYLERVVGEPEEIGYFAQLVMGMGDVIALGAGQELVVEEEVEPEPAVDDEVDPFEDEGVEGEDGSGVEEDEEEGIEAEEAEPKKAPATASFSSRAETALQAAAELSPQSAAPHYWLARLRFHEGQEGESIEAYERAVNADPMHVASRLAVGRRYYDRGDLNNATEHLQKIIAELAPSASTKERAEAHHFMGMVHMARQRSHDAITMFTEALNIDTSRADTLRALAQEYERAEMYKEALNFFTTNKNLGQQDPNVMLGIVRSYMGLEQWSDAIGQLQDGEKLFPADARFPFYLGQLNLLRGNFSDARQALERAVEIDPTLLTAHASLAQLAWRIDQDISRGEGHIRRIVEQPDLLDAQVAAQVAEYYHLSERREPAQEWNRAALRLDPNFWAARLSLSRLLLEEGKNDQALELLERARTEGIEDIRLSAYLADAYRQSGRFDQAIDEINKVIEEFSSNEEYIFIRGRIYFDRGNYDTAREDFNKAYELNPRFHDAYFYVGRTAFEQKDYNNALRIFRHVLDYQPNNGEYHYFMGRTFEEEENVSQALEQYRRATAVDPGYGASNPTIFIRRGRILSRLGYTREGKRDIEQALELAPEMLEARLAMGESDFRDKNYKSAIEHFTKALAENADEPDAQYRLGMSYIYEGNRPDGARHLQLAVRYGYDNPDIYRTLGYLYRELGQNGQALESFKTFLRETANANLPDSTRREMLRQITELGG